MSTIHYSPTQQTHVVQFTLPGQPYTLEFQRYVPLLDVLIEMERTGGGFHSALGTAWLRADASNKARLIRAFGDNLDAYAERVAERHRLTHDQVFAASLVKSA